MLQAKMNGRVSERHAIHHVANMAELGGGRFEKLPARRRVEKNVFDFDGCAEGNGGFNDPLFFSALYPKPMTARRIRQARSDLHARHRSDAGQRLAAKPKGGDAKEIFVAC